MGGVPPPVVQDQGRRPLAREEIVRRAAAREQDVDLELEALLLDGGPDRGLEGQLIVEPRVRIEERETRGLRAAVLEGVVADFPAPEQVEAGRADVRSEQDLRRQLVLGPRRKAKLRDRAARPPREQRRVEPAGQDLLVENGSDAAQARVRNGERRSETPGPIARVAEAEAVFVAAVLGVRRVVQDCRGAAERRSDLWASVSCSKEFVRTAANPAVHRLSPKRFLTRTPTSAGTVCEDPPESSLDSASGVRLND